MNSATCAHAAQFETTWKELRSALDESGESGLLLGASGAQILLDGVPLGAGRPSEVSLSCCPHPELPAFILDKTFRKGISRALSERFRAETASRRRLAEQLKAALAGETTIKVNEIRYIAEDSSIAGAKIAANFDSKVLGAQGDKFRDFLEDPNPLAAS